MLVNTPSPLSSVAILRDGFTVAVGGVDGESVYIILYVCVCVCACVNYCCDGWLYR